jgi:hypothetical protein
MLVASLSGNQNQASQQLLGPLMKCASLSTAKPSN